MSQHKLLLIDAYALLYRAYFAHKQHPRITSQGLNTGTILGFTNTLFDILNKEKPSHVAVAFDAKGPTFREEIYPAYKAHREAQPEEITASLPYIERLLTVWQLPVLRCTGYEADDIIGTLVHQFAPIPSVMLTPDKDYAQLVTEQAHLLRPAHKTNPAQRLGPKEVQEKFGVLPNQIIDLLGLQGDASDNIPGVTGVGPKTALQLLTNYTNLTALYQALDNDNTPDIPPKLITKLRNQRNQAFLSKELATIHLNTPLSVELNNLKLQSMDRQILGDLFRELEFRTLSKRILGAAPDLFDKPNRSGAVPVPKPIQATTTAIPPAALNFSASRFRASPSPPNYHQITSTQSCAALVPYLMATPKIAMHLLFEGDKAIDATPIALGLCYHPDEAFVISLQEEAQARWQLLAPVFARQDLLRVTAQAKADHLLLAQWVGAAPQGTHFDICLAHYLIATHRIHTLEAMTGQYLTSMTSQDTYFTLTDAQLNTAQAAHQVLALHDFLQKELKELGMVSLYEEVENPLVDVLAAMERYGVLVDQEALIKLSTTYGEELDVLEKKIYTQAGQSFNILSPKQLGQVLFVDLRLVEKPKKTRTGLWATNEEVLQGLTKHSIVRHVLDYRTIHKLRSTYIEALPKFIDPNDQRIHTDFRQSIAATGRLSSNLPNLQNIPIRTERGKRLRTAFIAAPNHLLLSADYSQIELRIMAAFAKETAMLEAFDNNLDIHALTASRIFNTQPKQITSAQRRLAKSTNFGIIYGISSFGLANTLQISRSEAQQFIQAYFEAFPKIRDYMEHIKAKAKTQGYVDTLWGRRRWLPDIDSRNAATRHFAERNAINAPIQGTAADIIKKAMLNVHAFLTQQHPTAHLILQIHDELLIEAPKKSVMPIHDALPQLMETVAPELGTPLTIATHIGHNWWEAHE